MGAAKSKRFPEDKINHIPSSEDSEPNGISANFRWLDDRIFVDAAYMLPSDSQEFDRARLRHQIYMTMMNHILAPIEVGLERLSFLDIGCGPGDWCVKVASDYPNVSVLGIDIVKAFPETENPKNCRFEIVDALKLPMPFDDNSFDLIHIEVFFLCIQTAQYSDFLTDIMRILKPGGYLQWIEPDMWFWNGGPACKDMFKYVIQAVRLRDLEPYLGRKYEDIVKQRGFINTKHTYVSVPSGSWGGELGNAAASTHIEGLLSLSPILCTAFGWSVEEFNTKRNVLMKENEQSKIYQNVYLLVAGKPLSV